MRSMDHPDYVRTYRPQELRDRLSALHRKRWGAPDGYCTVHGIHVPFEHRDPVRYWAGWFAHNHGKDAATEFILSLKFADWSDMPRIRDLWLRKKQNSRNAETIRKIVWEAYHANQNSR